MLGQKSDLPLGCVILILPTLFGRVQHDPHTLCFLHKLGMLSGKFGSTIGNESLGYSDIISEFDKGLTSILPRGHGYGTGEFSLCVYVRTRVPKL
jgi:hypothetical protein